MKKLFYLIIFFTNRCVANGDYINYYKLINNAEKMFVTDTTNKNCLIVFDQAFNSVERPFVSDVFKATQISYFLKDTSIFFKFSKLCFERGLSLNEFKYAPIFIKLLENQYFKSKLLLIEKKCMPPNYDKSLKDSTYRRYYEEQKLKRIKGGESQFFQKEIENTNYFIQSFESGRFPSEQLIGLYRQTEFEEFMLNNNLEDYHDEFEKQIASSPGTTENDEDICNNAAIYSFLHYPCSFINFKAELWKSVEAGYIQPKLFGLLDDWTCGYKKRMEANNYCKIYDEKPKYLIWNKKPLINFSKEELIEIEVNRSKIYVQEYQIDQLKKKLESNTGIRFFYGFLGKV